MSNRNLILAAAGAGEAADPNFNQTVLLLHGDGTDGAQNNTFLDSSTNNFTVTRNGNTTQGTYSPFSAPDGGWSNFFDGTNDNLTVAYNSALNISGDFTLEAWIYLTGNAAQGSDGSRNANIYSIDLPSDGANDVLFFNIRGDSTTTGTGFNLRFINGGVFTGPAVTTTITQHEWHHIAVCRSSGSYYMFLDGVSQSYTGDALAATITTTQTRRIGHWDEFNDGFPWYFPGYIANLRHTNEALYTANFTPSISPLTTTSQGASSANVELLTCQSNRFVDNSSNGIAITPNGGAKVTPFSPFAPTAAYDASVNGGSGYFDGTGDYLSVADDADFDLGNGNFTIEGWYYLNSVSSGDGANFFGKWNSPNRSYALLYLESIGKYRVVYSTTGSNETIVDSAAIAPNLNQWVHLALVRNGTSLKLYRNGAEIISHDISTTTIYNASSSFMIGRLESNTNYDLDGYCSSLRFVKGTAVYTSAFTPPTAPLTEVSGTSLLTNFTNAGIFDQTGKNNLETVGNAQIDTTTKQFGTGSMEFDGTGDKLKIPYTPDLVLGTGSFSIEFWIYRNNTTGDMAILDARPSGSTDGWSIFLNSTNKFVFSAAGSNQATGTTTISSGTWYYIAITRSGSTLKIFVDGVEDASVTSSADAKATEGLTIGTKQYTLSGQIDFNGFLDEVRVTKGIARTISLPTKAFPDL